MDTSPNLDDENRDPVEINFTPSTNNFDQEETISISSDSSPPPASPATNPNRIPYIERGFYLLSEDEDLGSNRPSELLEYNPTAGFTQIHANPYQRGRAIIAIDYAYSLHDSGAKEVSYGLLFRRNSPYNCCSVLSLSPDVNCDEMALRTVEVMVKYIMEYASIFEIDGDEEY